jgi:2,3,4,5-tetrahydropyridine-2-carboxylate N-succinyltransferase
MNAPKTIKNGAETSMSDLQKTIETAWETRDSVNSATKGAVRDAVESALALLDKGEARVAEKKGGEWVVNQWLKKAVLLSFRLNDMGLIAGGPAGSSYWDKVAPKFQGWTEEDFKKGGFRVLPGAFVRRSAYIAPGVVLLPSFVNLGAYVDSGTMVEPLQAGPVIIEDNCFIGARAEVAEGVIVGEGSVLSMGVYLGASTTIIDRATGEKFFGRVPPYSVVVSGAMPGKPLPSGEPGPNLYCAVIVKRVDEKTRSKTSINELLRD